MSQSSKIQFYHDFTFVHASDVKAASNNAGSMCYKVAAVSSSIVEPRCVK